MPSLVTPLFHRGAEELQVHDISYRVGANCVLDINHLSLLGG